MSKWPDLVAFTGLSGAGKDEAAKCLLDAGYRRHNFGDIIKRQLDPLVKKHLGFSAHTEDRTKKAIIRRTLEMWGEDNYENILAEFLDTLPKRAVNTRLVRLKEAYAWKQRGGVIVCIERPNHRPATEWEADRLQELIDANVIDATVHNKSDIPTLQTNVGFVLSVLIREG